MARQTACEAVSIDCLAQEGPDNAYMLQEKFSELCNYYRLFWSLYWQASFIDGEGSNMVQYKKHNTCKFLIGITPQRSISFISKGWGERVSNVLLTENCGLLSKLLSGDFILADCGFTIDKAAGMYCAKAKIRSSLYKRERAVKQATAHQLSQVRIHVEIVIGLVRQSTVLHIAIHPFY